jgi:subtilase family serine protease
MRVAVKRIVVFAVITTAVSSGYLTAGSAPVQAAASTATPSVVPVCGPVPAGYAQCFSEIEEGGSVRGIPPKTLKSVYDFPTSPEFGQGQTIAIVSAFDAPTLESDLAVFDRRFGLPSCTTANGCFTKVNATGGSTPPATNAFWSYESHIDVEWAHAVAPGAKILLVEANTNAIVDLFAALDYAKLHAGYISNSWGSTEGPAESVFDHHFSQAEAPGVSFFFGSGDVGGKVFYPSVSPLVISVGGTELHFGRDGRFKSETGWSNGGGGCAQYEAASTAQASFSQYQTKGCAGQRATPDVSSLADPASGVALYDSQPDGTLVGWSVAGGTSLATPITAARAAGTGQLVDQAYVYDHKIDFRDITQGNNGFPCTVGYDLVTGRGSWIS